MEKVKPYAYLTWLVFAAMFVATDCDWSCQAWAIGLKIAVIAATFKVVKLINRTV